MSRNPGSAELHLSAFREYVNEHGHGRVPQKHVTADGLRLGKWVAKQRDLHREDRLPAGRAEALNDEPGWLWNAREGSWGVHLAALRDFVSTHARLPMRSEPVTPDTLHEWIHTQRRFYHAGRMPAARVDLLESVPHWQWVITQAEAQSRAVAINPPGPPRDQTPVSVGSDVCVEVRWQGVSLRDEPDAVIRAPGDVTLDRLVGPIVEAVGLDPYDTHLWRFMTTEGRKTDTQVTLGYPTNVDSHYLTRYEAADWAPYRPEPQQAAAGVPLLDVLPDAGDQMWFLYDYGDWHLFRLRVRASRPTDTGPSRVRTRSRAGFRRVSPLAAV